MNKKSSSDHHEERVIAIDPTHKGFAYVVFEGPERLIDWGNVYVEGRKLKDRISRLNILLGLYEPEVLVLEDYGHPESRRRKSACRLIRAGHELALRRELRSVLLGPDAVRGAFATDRASTKEEIARVIARRFPRELGPKLPPRRKIWMSEDLRINLFDAGALALAYFKVVRNKRGARRRAA